MSLLLKIPESYRSIATVAIKGLSNYCDTVICTTHKKLLTFYKGCLMKKCNIEVEVKHLEPFVEYEQNVEVYYILHGEDKVIIVKEGTSLEIIKTYANVYEMVISDHSNSGSPQLYMRTDKGFECTDIVENKEQSTSKFNEIQETSVVYTFCLKKLQKLKILYDTEQFKLSQKSKCFINAMMQVSSNDTSDLKLSLNLIAKNSWLKLSNKNLVYGFTLQNTSKLSISNFNIILLENNKEIWRKFCISCWTVEKTTNVFNFHGCDGNSMSSNIEKSNLKIKSNSSIIVSSVIDNWSSKSLPYSINSIVYINHENLDRIQYISTDSIIVTADLFLDKEFDSFVKNSVYLEDLVVLQCSKLLSHYQIKCTVCHQDLKNVMINNFKFNTKHEWFVHSSLSWLNSIVCRLDPISPVEYTLEVFSDSLVYTKTFIQVLSTMLPDHASIICLDKKIPTYLNIDAVVQDLKELRRVFMEYLDGQIMIPRKQWNIIRSKLLFT